MHQSSHSPPNTSFWPNATRLPEQHNDRFPVEAVRPWLLIGLCGLLLFLGLYTWLEHRAAKRIIYFTANGTLAAMRADGKPAPPLVLPDARFIGPVWWAPQGGRFAVIAKSSSGIEIVISDGMAAQAVRIPLVDPVSGFAQLQWAPSGNYLAVVSRDQTAHPLQIVDVGRARVVTVPLVPDTLANAIWHPRQNELLITAANDTGDLALWRVNLEGQAQLFAPDDGQNIRRQGAWSPDGRRIVYIGATSIDSAQQVIVANADGTEPRVLVAEGLNMLPVWSPRSDYIFFTQYDGQQYQLYRIRINGQGLTLIGRSLPPEKIVNDPSSAIAWAPDHSRMLFQSFDASASTFSIWVADYDGGNPLRITSNAGIKPLRVIWSSTSRGLLIADGERMSFRWLNREAAEPWPHGSWPSWEP